MLDRYEAFQTNNDDYSNKMNFTHESDDSFEKNTNKSRENEIKYELVPGKRRNSQLLWSSTELQFYKFNTKLKAGKSYLCYHGCSCRVLLLNNGICIKTDQKKTHNHPTNQELYEQLSIANEIKIKCSKDSSSKSVKQIYDDVLMK